MFKVADKMASVCLWVEPTAGAFQDLIKRPEGMYVRHSPPGRGTTAKLRNSKCNTHTYTRASTTYTDLLKNRWKTDMQFIFFTK